MSIDIPKDRDGRIARECPSGTCSPGYFKVKLGTGLKGQQTAFCPYCRREAPPNDFATEEQIRYAKDLVVREAQRGVGDMIKEAFRLGPTGKRRIGSGGFVSMELSYKRGTPRHVRSPYEDEVRRDVTCPHCALDQTVFGLATWCADCGMDIFLVHVGAEIAVTKLMLDDVDRRRESLGQRVAMKDVENCLEDAVSIFEASAKALVRRRLALSGNDAEAIQTEMKKIGNAFQSMERSKEQLTRLFTISPSDSALWTRMGVYFEKRHPVTHNLGVVDKKYLERTHLNLTANACEFFFRSLVAAMKFYGDMREGEGFGSAFERNLGSIFSDPEDRQSFIDLAASLEGAEQGRDFHSLTLDKVLQTKLLCDAYILRKFGQQADERAAREAAASSGSEVPS